MPVQHRVIRLFGQRQVSLTRSGQAERPVGLAATQSEVINCKDLLFYYAHATPVSFQGPKACAILFIAARFVCLFCTV